MAKDTKERILSAALDMFSKNGYAGANIRELSLSESTGSENNAMRWCKNKIPELEKAPPVISPCDHLRAFQQNEANSKNPAVCRYVWGCGRGVSNGDQQRGSPRAGTTAEPWGQRTCYIADPEGNLIEIGSRNKPYESKDDA